MKIAAIVRVAWMPWLLALAGCNPHLSSAVKPDPEIIQARTDYQSKWSEAIAQQEIYKGMEKADVYFSWGRPQHRFRTGDHERWIYLFRGDGDQPDRVVWLHFYDGKLRKWSVDRGYMEFMNPETVDKKPEAGNPKGKSIGK